MIDLSLDWRKARIPHVDHPDCWCHPWRFWFYNERSDEYNSLSIHRDGDDPPPDYVLRQALHMTLTGEDGEGYG